MSSPELAVELAKLRGEVSARMDRLDGKVDRLEATLTGRQEARRREVDGQIALLTEATRRLASEREVDRDRIKTVEADVTALHSTVRKEREERLADTARFDTYLAEQRSARDTTEKHLRRVSWVLGVIVALLTILIAIQQAGAS